MIINMNCGFALLRESTRRKKLFWLLILGNIKKLVHRLNPEAQWFDGYKWQSIFHRKFARQWLKGSFVLLVAKISRSQGTTQFAFYYV